MTLTGWSIKSFQCNKRKIQAQPRYQQSFIALWSICSEYLKRLLFIISTQKYGSKATLFVSQPEYRQSCSPYGHRGMLTATNFRRTASFGRTQIKRGGPVVMQLNENMHLQPFPVTNANVVIQSLGQKESSSGNHVITKRLQFLLEMDNHQLLRLMAVENRCGLGFNAGFSVQRD